MKTGKQELQLIGLKIQDLQNIELVNVDFRGKKFVEVTGKNGAAKSTVIDAIFLGIKGPTYMGRGYPTWRLIKDDADRALLKVIIGNSERNIEIKRSITKKQDEDGTYRAGGMLTIKDSDGMKLGQEFLDNLISQFTVDPVSFSRKSAAEQIEIIKQLGNINTAELDKARDQAYSERTIIGRKMKDIEPAIRIEPPKADMVDISEVSETYKKKLGKNQEIEQAKKDAAVFDERTEEIKKEVEELIAEIKRLQSLAEKRQDQIGEREFIAKSRVINDPENLEYLELAMKTAGATNMKAAARKTWEEKTAEYEKLEKEFTRLDGIVKAYPEEKQKLIKASKLPFTNIDFDDSIGLLIDGIPFTQKSDAEKIRISTRIGMELKPDFKIICIKDGSLLDEESLAVIKELSSKYNYQVLVETVGEKEGEDCITMRAGRVISEFNAKPAAPEKIADSMENTL